MASINFWFDYNFNPQPGPRQWKQDDPTHWREIYPDGHADIFIVVGASPDPENPGTIVWLQPGNNRDVLIPPLKEGAPFKFRRTPSLSVIHLSPKTSAATPPATAPATQPATRPSS